VEHAKLYAFCGGLKSYSPSGKHCLRRPGVDTLTDTQRTICLTTLKDATFQTGSTHADVSWADCSPSSARDGMTPLSRLQFRGTNYKTWGNSKYVQNFGGRTCYSKENVRSKRENSGSQGTFFMWVEMRINCGFRSNKCHRVLRNVAYRPEDRSLKE
jgi:hypothetical protein